MRNTIGLALWVSLHILSGCGNSETASSPGSGQLTSDGDAFRGGGGLLSPGIANSYFVTFAELEAVIGPNGISIIRQPSHRHFWIVMDSAASRYCRLRNEGFGGGVYRFWENGSGLSITCFKGLFRANAPFALFRALVPDSDCDEQHSPLAFLHCAKGGALLGLHANPTKTPALMSEFSGSLVAYSYPQEAAAFEVTSLRSIASRHALSIDGAAPAVQVTLRSLASRWCTLQQSALPDWPYRIFEAGVVTDWNRSTDRARIVCLGRVAEVPFDFGTPWDRPTATRFDEGPSQGAVDCGPAARSALDIDGDQRFTGIDAALLARLATSVPAQALLSGLVLSPSATRATSSALAVAFEAIRGDVAGLVPGGGMVTSTTEAILLARFVQMSRSYPRTDKRSLAHPALADEFPASVETAAVLDRLSRLRSRCVGI